MPPYSMRDTKGRFTSRDSFGTQNTYTDGANRGNQTWTGNLSAPTGVQLNPESLQKLLADPILLREITTRTQAMLQQANSQSITEGAEYGSIIYNNRPELGPVGVVFCENYESVLDDAYHGTLHKMLAGLMGKGLPG